MCRVQRGAIEGWPVYPEDRDDKLLSKTSETISATTRLQKEKEKKVAMET